MWEALLVVVVALGVAGAGLRFAGWWIRRRAVAAIPSDRVTRSARDISMRVKVQGTRAFHGMSTRSANRTRGDLVLAGDRFLIATNRGALADIGPGHGRRFTSVRCTGPGRLVIEGDVPGPAGRTGLYRVEVHLPDAADWAEALAPFVQESAGPAARFGRRPPVAPT